MGNFFDTPDRQVYEEFVSCFEQLYKHDSSLYFRFYTDKQDIDNSIYIRIDTYDPLVTQSTFEIIHKGIRGIYRLEEWRLGYQFINDKDEISFDLRNSNVHTSIQDYENMYVDLWLNPLNNYKR